MLMIHHCRRVILDVKNRRCVETILHFLIYYNLLKFGGAEQGNLVILFKTDKQKQLIHYQQTSSYIAIVNEKAYATYLLLIRLHCNLLHIVCYVIHISNAVLA